MNDISTVLPTNGPDEWKKIVNIYGLRPLSEDGFMVAGIYLTIVGVLSTVGNSIVLATFLRDKELLRKPQNLLLLNLVISDLGITLFGYPWTTASNFAGRYLFGQVFCSIQGFMTFTFAQTDMNTLACISFFRYITICYPQYAHNLNFEVTKSTIAFTWIYTLLWTTPPLFGWSSYTLEPFGTSCSIDWSNSGARAVAYTWCLIMFCFLIHVFIMIISYYKIVLKIREVDGRTQPSIIHSPSTGELMQTVHIKREKKATVIAFLLNVTFIVVWLPYTVVCLWSVYDKNIPSWVTTFPTFFAKASCMMNPFLYFLTNSKLRKQARRLFMRHVGRVGPYPPRPSQPLREFNPERIYRGQVTISVEKIDSTMM